jgi:hypothetical protein
MFEWTDMKRRVEERGGKDGRNIVKISTFH